MAKRLLVLLLLFGSIGALAIAQTSSQVIESPQDSDDSEDNYDEGYYYDGVVWNGPGYYYGVWFSTEAALNGWRRDHYWRGDRGEGRSYGGGFRGGRGGGRR